MKAKQVHHWLLVSLVRGLGGFAGVGATFIASRKLGADQAGLIFLTLSIVTVLATFSRMGLDNAVVRHIGMHAADSRWAQVQGTYRLALKWTASLSSLTALVVFLSADLAAHYIFHMPAFAPVMRIMALLIPIMAMYTIYVQAFIGIRSPEIATFLMNVSFPAGFIALLLMLDLTTAPPPDAVSGASAYLLSGVSTLAIGLLLWNKRVPAATPKADPTAVWKSAAPLWVAAVMVQFVNWSGQIVSGAWLLSAEVAHLAAAQRTALLISLVLMITNMITAPRFASLYHQGKKEELKQLARKTTRIMALISTPVVVAVCLLATPLMQMFGPGFEEGAILLQILAITQWINATTGSVGFLLQMTGHEKDMKNITVVSGLAAMTLSALLTWSWGVTGAALATAIAISMQNVAGLVIVRHRLGFWTVG